MRAARVLATRPERAIVALAELCEERKAEDLISAPPYVAPRLSAPPPQTPYTVGSQSMRPKGAPQAERLSPPTKFFEPGPRHSVSHVSIRPPPEHMAPKRSKWTSPPPAEAPPADHTFFENQLGMGLELATSSTEAREKEASYNSSSSNSEFLTDEDQSDTAESDDVTSVRSFTEGSNPASSGGLRRPSWHTQDTVIRIPQSSLSGMSVGRGRHPRISDKQFETSPVPSFRQTQEMIPSSSRSEYSSRTIPGPLRRGPAWPHNTPLGVSVPLPPSPDSPLDPNFAESSTVFYQTTVPKSPRPNVLYPNPGSHSSLLSQYQSHQYRNLNSVPADIFPANLPPSLTSMNPRAHAGLTDAGRSSAGPDTPTPASYSHSHSLSSTTITAPTPPPHTSKFSQIAHNSSPFNAAKHRSRSRSRLRSRSPGRSPVHAIPTHHGHFIVPHNGSSSPQPSSTSNGSSPTPSSTGYATSSSRSPSPHSPSPPPTAMPIKTKENDLVYSSSFTTAEIHDGSSEPPPGV
jgi:terminal uridylyltransferase